MISELSDEKKITDVDFDFLEINNPNRGIKLQEEIRFQINKQDNNSISQSDFSDMS